MNLSIGIIGLPNVGKSTLFNALLRKQAAASANFPFTTIEPNVGVVPVPDERLEKLAKVVGTQTVIPATVKFVDIAGLVKGASEGEGLGNKFLSHIREVDATVHLVRDFQDSEVVRVGESPEKDIEIVNTELQLADLETIGKLLDEAERQTKASRDPQTINKLNALEKIKESLEKGLLASEASLTEVEKEAVGVLPLLTVKPQVITLNVDEDKLAGEGLRISAKLESELAELTEEEAREYLSELGVEESGLEKLVRKMYQTLGLISFFTAGEKEARAWTVKAGTKAPQAAGVIHTDFEKGFIKADVVTWEKLVEASGWAEARAKGLVRLEVREYAVADGDVCLFRFQ
jgi:ribosome-binding ATPase YchF (GTP1/OBG family)